jgi:hypothetical protein
MATAPVTPPPTIPTGQGGPGVTPQPVTNLPSNFTAPAGAQIDQGNGPVTVGSGGGTTQNGTLYSRNAPNGPTPATPTGPVQIPNDPSLPATGLSESENEARSNQSIMVGLGRTLDGINAQYDKILNDSKSGPEAEALGRAKALAASSGDEGSTAALGTQSKAAASNYSSESKIQNERVAAIASATKSANDLWAKTQASMQKANDDSAPGTPSASAAENVANRQSVADIVANMTKVIGNVNYSQFKSTDPDTAAKIESILGGGKAGAAEAELLWNAQQKATGSTSASDYKWVSGQAFQYDPTTGNMTRRPDLDTTTGSGSGTTYGTVNLNGHIYLAPLDFKGKPIYDPTKPNFGLTAFSGTPNAPDTSKPPTPNDLKGAISDMASQIQPQAGQDGYVSPQDYKAGKAAWVKEGFKASDYDSNFGYLVNPSHTADYGYKAPTTPKSSTGNSPTSAPIPGITP